MRMLLIEDDEMSRELWTLLLANEGYEVEVAGSGEQAMQLLQRAREQGLEAPDVVLADLQLPGLSGAALASALRASGRQRSERRERTLLLAMSASEPRRTALKGFDGFLLKPFSMETLGMAISGAGMRAENGIARLEPRQRANEVTVLDEAVFARFTTAMPGEKLQELYRLFLHDTRMRLERLRSAAAERHDEVFRRGAHEIKGACGMIGATELRAMAAAMEESGLTRGAAEVTASLNRFATACERLEAMLERRWAHPRGDMQDADDAQVRPGEAKLR
jgi:CheY-like chemotaxis protein